MAALFALALSSAPQAHAAVTVYTGSSSVTTASLSPSATYSGYAAYDPTVLVAPAAPQPPTTSYTLNAPASIADLATSGLSVSIPQRGNFLGFSIELSVADVVMGKKGNQLKPPFLNYMANIETRAGVGPVIRVGGNTQEGSTLFVDGLADGASIDKLHVDENGVALTSNTPVINYSADLFYVMSNISSLVKAEWYFGLAFNTTAVADPSANVDLAAKTAAAILGSNLKGLGVGNEPDLYVDHGKRPSGWTLQDYLSEYQETTQQVLSADSGSALNTSSPFLGPSLCCNNDGFTLPDLLATSWLSDNTDTLAAFTVQHYPTNNCQVNGVVIDPQDVFADFLNHTSAQSEVAFYSTLIQPVVQSGKEVIMLETNTASCGGFAGLSDSFGAAMWMTDYALQMAFANFSAALMHVGGQNVYYNPFTPPPSNYTGAQWTTGSVYYPTLVVAEAFGQSGNARISDLLANNNDEYHPAYGIYENDQLARAVLFNFVNDPTGASTTSVSIASTAGSVQVRYLSAPTVSEQYNITWAGQTLGTSFQSDGRLSGTQQTDTITCENGYCVIPVPAPSIALVFMSDQALEESSPQAQATATFATTVIGSGSATLDPAVLETSNGQNGGLGSNSKGSVSADVRSKRVGTFGLVLGATISLLGRSLLS